MRFMATTRDPTRGELVDSIEHILGAAYNAVSGPPASRDWDIFRGLLTSDARFIVCQRDPSGNVIRNTLTTDEFIRRVQLIVGSTGFYETPLAHRIEVWDSMAHVWSTYESRHFPGEKPFTRGINSFQLFNDGTRWWILSIFWQNEDASHPVPAKYLE